MFDEMGIGEGLAYGQEVYEELRFLPHDMFDWKGAVKTLVNTNAFTVPQIAALLGRNPTYVQREVRQEFGDASGKRSRFGVSGKFNPDSLTDIRMLRVMWHDNKGSGRTNSHTREQIAKVLDQGNGVRLLAHLTGIPATIINRVRIEQSKESNEAS